MTLLFQLTCTTQQYQRLSKHFTEKWVPDLGGGVERYRPQWQGQAYNWGLGVFATYVFDFVAYDTRRSGKVALLGNSFSTSQNARDLFGLLTG